MTDLLSYVRSFNINDLRHYIFPSISKKTLVRYYLPASGIISHSLFTMNIFVPSIFNKLFSIYDLAVSNVFLFQSHFAIGFYIFFRPHLYRLNNWNRVQFSVFSSVMYNFGSILLAIFLKPILPKRINVISKAFIGIALSFFTLWTGRKYVCHIDSRTNLLKNALLDLYVANKN